MPRLVRNAVPIAAWVGEGEPVIRGVSLQPCERRRVLEFFFEWREAGRGEVHAAAGVMFAVAGRGADAQDFIDAQAPRELAFDDAELVFDRAERGNDLQRHALSRG